MLDRFKPGSDLSIMNCHYQYSIKDAEGNRTPDYLAIIYKNNETGKKDHEIIQNPEFTFYVMKGDAPDYNQLFIERDKVEPVTCKYSQLKKKIAEITGNLDFYNNNISTGNSSDNEKLHTIPSIFASDVNIEDYYRKEFGKKFTNNITRLTKSFYDIEVDTRYMSGDFVRMGECPINCIGYFNANTYKITSYLLRDSRNPLIQQFEDELNFNRFTYNDIKEFIKSAVGGWKQYKRYNLDQVEIEIKFFDYEIELLKDFFAQVHIDDNDFIMGWNSSAFDLEYIINRILELNYEPADIMCDQSWEIKQVKNYVDQKHLSEFAERGDYTFISGNTTWIDQMIQFCSRRKAKIGSFDSFKLDDIGNMIAKVHKLDYSHITNDIAMLPWLDYKTFVLYNFMDVIVQHCIEFKSNDLEYIFAKALMNNTSYRKIHRQTVYLINRMNKEFEKLGYIIGNNVNKWNEQPDKFAGALVGDPLNINNYPKMKIGDTYANVIDSGQDFDYKSLYPSIDLENNIAPNTQIGKIEIEEKIYDNENRYLNDKYERGGEFIENLVCDNIISFSNRWLHLANFNELLSDIQEYYMMTFEPVTVNNFILNDCIYVNGKYILAPFKVAVDNKINPFSFTLNNSINPFNLYNPRPTERN